MKWFWLGIFALFIASPALAQQLTEIVQTAAPNGEGWRGFTNSDFLINALLNLLLAAILGAIIAYHPRHSLTADTLEEIEATQIYILYAVIGAITGILVVQYGMVVGFVLFGIGGLIRFRTVLRSASLTGRLIFVTLIGLSAGLDMPHVAVLVTAFGFLLIFVLDARFTFRILIRGVPSEDIRKAAAAYRAVMLKEDCRILSEKKRPDQGRITFIIRSKNAALGKELEEKFETAVDKSLRASADWEIE